MRSEEFAAGQPSDELSEADKRILDFAKSNHRGIREGDIAKEFGYQPTTFYQRLNSLLDNPAALAYDPLTVNRHRRYVDRNLTQWGRQPRYSNPEAKS